MLSYTVKRANRKTAAIYVLKDGSIEVRCPKNINEREIEKFVNANRQLLETKTAGMREQALKKNAFAVSPGDSLLFLGERYPLETVDFPKMGFDGSRFYAPGGMPANDLKSGLIKIYKSLAEQWLTSKTQEYAKIMRLNPVDVKVNSAKTRWGSCSGKNSINYSWRLIMAGERCVDYVVIHELAHIAEHNHGSRFWSIVEQYMPDCKEQKKKLKELQNILACENWD